MGGICLTHGILASLFTARVNSISEYASHIGMLIPLNVGASCILSTILFNNMATAHHNSRDIHILFIHNIYLHMVSYQRIRESI
jgi:hypothetical protein